MRAHSGVHSVRQIVEHIGVEVEFDDQLVELFQVCLMDFYFRASDLRCFVLRIPTQL